MRVTIQPGRAEGVLSAPPSKSMAHRLLICAGLSRGESMVRSLAPSEDILATIDCLRALGARIQWEKDAVRVTGCEPAKASPALLPCRESGSTLRFMLPLCLLSGASMCLTGSETLLQRPLSIYEAICRDQGLRYQKDQRELQVQGRLSPGAYAVPGGVSSQFISGLLFALPLLREDSSIRLIPPVESRSYLDMTLQALGQFGVRASWQDEYTLAVPGGAFYTPQDVTVEGDYSNAAFFEALNCLGGRVRLENLRPDSLQGDKIYGAYFSSLMAGYAELNVADCPDLAPVLFAVAAARHGARFTGTRRLRYKESDRGAAMAEELAKFGVRTTLNENEIIIHPGPLRPPSEALSSHNDHRVAMALSVLCTRTGGQIEGAQAVRKSLPDYWDRLKNVHSEVKTDGLEQ